MKKTQVNNVSRFCDAKALFFNPLVGSLTKSVTELPAISTNLNTELLNRESIGLSQIGETFQKGGSIFDSNTRLLLKEELSENVAEHFQSLADLGAYVNVKNRSEISEKKMKKKIEKLIAACASLCSDIDDNVLDEIFTSLWSFICVLFEARRVTALADKLNATKTAEELIQRIRRESFYQGASNAHLENSPLLKKRKVSA
jgi:hypothetical protein